MLVFGNTWAGGAQTNEEGNRRPIRVREVLKAHPRFGTAGFSDDFHDNRLGPEQIEIYAFMVVEVCRGATP